MSGSSVVCSKTELGAKHPVQGVKKTLCCDLGRCILSVTLSLCQPLLTRFAGGFFVSMLDFTIRPLLIVRVGLLLPLFLFTCAVLTLTISGAASISGGLCPLLMRSFMLISLTHLGIFASCNSVLANSDLDMYAQVSRNLVIRADNSWSSLSRAFCFDILIVMIVVSRQNLFLV